MPIGTGIKACKKPFRALILLALLSLCGPGVAQESATVPVAEANRYIVAVREVPPFAMRDTAGNWEGLSVDLWQDVADKLNIEFEWREASLEDTLALLAEGEADIGIAALSVTGAREKIIDFSHPYYVTGLSPAFAANTESAWMATLRRFFSLEFLSAVSSLALVLLTAGFFIWIFERRTNAQEFGNGEVRRGLGDGFWWSAVTMTTVGYGDKAPKTLGGRIVALVWMFVSLIIIASFTASIAASLTANELSAGSFRDRPVAELTVGVLTGSAAEGFATNRGARVRAYDSIALAIEALVQGELDTVIHDSPILRYEARRSESDVQVLDRILVRDDYAFAFPEASSLRNDVNLALLDILFDPTWQNIRQRYLGGASSELQ